MQAIIFPEPGRIEVDDVASPEPGPAEVVVRVTQAGLCGTDLHIYRNEYQSRFPLTPGHEFVGLVAATRRDVTGLREGDRVVVDPNIDCGTCYFCRRQQNNHCLNWQGVGITRAGGFAEAVAVPARACYRVPQTLSDAAAAFIEPLACVVYAMSRLPLTPADDVLVYGAGPIGLVLIQSLRLRGPAQLVVVEKQPHRLELARQMGATVAFAPADASHETLRTLAPHGFDVVVDATGVPTVIEQALERLKPGGRLLQFGVAPAQARVSVSPYQLFRHDLTLIGSFALCYTFDRAIHWLAQGLVEVAPLVDPVLPLSHFADGFERFVKGDTLKVQFTPAG